MSTTRNSKQRDAVLSDLQSRYDHPTAEEVYFSVKKSFPNISLATVYRNLCFLNDEGKIFSINGRDAVHYDAHLHEHNHLLCRTCGRIFDVNICINSSFLDDANTNFNGCVDGYSLLFHGLCNSCNKVN